jgi:hypothetical protein
MRQLRLSRSETASAPAIDLEIVVSASYDLWRIAVIKVIVRNAANYQRI